jgi:hypothetical protein
MAGYIYWMADLKQKQCLFYPSPCLPHKGGGNAVALFCPITNVRTRDTGYSCLSSASPPETSTFPGASSMFSFFTTPSSTSME